MKSLFLLFITLLASYSTFSQVTGTVTNDKNETLPYVNVFIENTYTGTTTNEDGIYELNITKTGRYTVVYQFLGYTTKKLELDIQVFPFEQNVILNETQISLNEVVVSTEDNPANAIIRNAVKNRKINLNKVKSYTADFYSRGLIRIKNAPEKILGVEIGDLGGGLDSTRSGIIYLSETTSKLQYLFPDKLKETITASKVSGNDSGFSFNTALDANFNFYQNTVKLGVQVVSPIADFAFSHYRYKLEGTFYDDNNNLINKIAVIPKQKTDRVFSGYIYIIEDQWTIYGIELEITGAQAGIPAADRFVLTQNFKYSAQDQIWALISQNFDFEYAIFDIKVNGKFTAIFSNYIFNGNITKRSFNRELVSFVENANKKDSAYWTMKRPVALTNEEIQDYLKKDSIQLVKKSKPYLDSIDGERNKFKLLSPITGYTFQNSHKNYKIGYDGLVSKINYNTIQGYHVNSGLFFVKNFDEYKRYFSARANFNYGFSDNRLRTTGSALYKFNNISRATISVSGGITTQQFNEQEPISPLINSVASLFFKNNFLKLYDKSFVQFGYSEELLNGFRVFGNISYERRKSLFNTSNQVFINNDQKIFTSNNPLDPTAFGIAPFETHNIVKLNVATQIDFGQNYLSFPDAKVNLNNEKYPTLTLGYEQGLGATNLDYNFQQIKVRLHQNFDVSNKGRFAYNVRVGKLFNSENIAFMDFQHFNGNQTQVSVNGNYTNVFNNLEYYRLSTNNSYFESHFEHNFKGFLLNKIPLLNKLGFNTVVGFHNLATTDNKPYQEFSIGLNNIGWGKFRYLRLDYVRSYQGSYLNDAIVFGLSFFN